MARIVVILLVASGLGFALGSIESGLQAEVEERFYLASDNALNAASSSLGGQSGAGSIGQSPNSVGLPRVEFPEGTKFKFEAMKHGTTMSHKFPLRNSGTAPLKLEKAGSTCKCTVGELDDNIIMPGETTLINLEWRGVSVTANFGQSATFKTNSVELPEFKLEIYGAVIDSFVLDPDHINLGTFAADVGTSREFSVYGYTEGVELHRLEWENTDQSKFIKLTSTPFSPSDSAGHSKALKAHKVKLEVLPGLPVGSLSGKIILQTNHGDAIDRLELAVNGTVSSEISFLGGSLFRPDLSVLTIGTVDPSSGFSTKIWLVLRGKEHEKMEVSVDQINAQESLKVSLGERKIESSRTMIPINFDVPKGAPNAYYPGNGKGTYAEVVVRANAATTVELPIHVRLIITK